MLSPQFLTFLPDSFNFGAEIDDFGALDRRIRRKLNSARNPFWCIVSPIQGRSSNQLSGVRTTGSSFGTEDLEDLNFHSNFDRMGGKRTFSAVAKLFGATTKADFGPTLCGLLRWQAECGSQTFAATANAANSLGENGMSFNEAV